MGWEKWALAAKFPHARVLQKGYAKPCPQPAGRLPVPQGWKEVPPRGGLLPAPRDGALVAILLALFLPRDSWASVGMGWGLTGGQGRVPFPGLLLSILLVGV